MILQQLTDYMLTKVDRASMMHSLEVRAPFLDIELVDFVRRIPWQYKLRGGQTKYLLKKALEPVLPNDILYRSKKGLACRSAPGFSRAPSHFRRPGQQGSIPASLALALPRTGAAQATSGPFCGTCSRSLVLPIR